MYMLIIILVAAILIGLSWSYKQEKVFAFIISFGVIAFFWFIFSMLLNPFYQKEYEKREEIVLMKDGTETEGLFALFGGYIDGNQVFNYYTDNNGVKRLESVDADEATIIEDSKVPYVNVTCEKTQSSDWFVILNYDECYGPYEFHVPEGSISTGVVLDGE